MPDVIAYILRERLRAEPVARMQAARQKLAAEPLAPMTPDEISAEIEAYRFDQRRATDS